jgi:hypothetical protein
MVRLVQRLAWLGLLALIVLSVFSAVAAHNAVDESGLSYASFQATANQLKPSQCDSLNLVDIVINSGTIRDDADNTLVLGSSGVDSIRGRGGNDCILGGGGSDTIDGDAGDDVVLAGDGSDTLIGDRGNDMLYGGNGNDYLEGNQNTDSCNGGNGTDTADASTCETDSSIEIWW